MKIIGVTGKAGCGKDTVATYLCQNKGFVQITFGGAVKDIVHIITGWSRDMIEGQTPESRLARETVIHEQLGMTCRQLLQFVGTDLFRQQLNQNIWINIVRDKTNDIIKNNKNVKGIVISDVRFDNEAQFIKSIGGIIVKIVRPQVVKNTTLVMNENMNDEKNHISEKGIEIDVDHIINNNSSIDYLYTQIVTITDELLI